MPDTGERREISRFADAKEVETIQHSDRVNSKTKQQSQKAAQENRARKERKAEPSSGPAAPKKVEEARQDREAVERMADEGAPNPKP